MTSAVSSGQLPLAPEAAEELEREVDQANALCDGDMRAALRAMVLANAFLDAEVERLTRAVSAGFTRQKRPPCQASDKINEWRKLFCPSGEDDNS